MTSETQLTEEQTYQIDTLWEVGFTIKEISVALNLPKQLIKDYITDKLHQSEVTL